MTTKPANSMQQYLCIEESVGQLVYKYFNQELGDTETLAFEDHLLLCFKCQEILFSLEAVFESLRADRKQRLSVEELSKGQE